MNDAMELPRDAKDITGKRFTRLLVVGPSHIDRHGSIHWHCKCDCGNEKAINGKSLKRGLTKSCGCIKKGSRSKNGSYVNYLIRCYALAAKKRNLVFDLDVEQFKHLISLNCLYCDSPPLNFLNRGDFHGDFYYNGIDRVDSSIGYVYENCVPCCKYCNRAKSDMSMEEFKIWLKRITSHLQL